MTTTQPPATPGSSARRLGQVLRFSPGAAAKGLKWLDAQGLSVASSRDFGDPNVPVPHDFQGADAQYFERFGIVVVRNGFERLETTLSKVLDSKVLDAHRKELSYGVTDTSDYLRGYRDGVSDLAGRMLDSSDETASDVLEAAADDTNGMGKNGAWALETLRVPSSQLSGAGIRVAILDTGLSESHPDFKGREVVRKRFASVDSTDDLSGHGTRCAGLACGPRVPTGGAPRYGVAYDAEIYAGKISGDDEKATDRSIIAGLHWALDQRCQVVSLSFGSPTDMGDVPNDYYEDIGRTCLDAGTLLIASAGNASSRPKSIAPITSPANASTVMAVGAIDRRLRVAKFSCGGINPGQAVDLVAPGVDVLSSTIAKYGWHNTDDGTSYSAPLVAGIAALLAQSNQAYRGWTLWARLLQTTRPLTPPARDVGRGLSQAPQR